MWAKVLSTTPHLLHKGLLVSPIKWRCLLRVLCSARRPVTTLDCVLLKDKRMVLVARLGNVVNSWACLWVLLRPRHLAKCWLSIWHFYFSSYMLPGNLQGWLRSNKLLNRTVSCELVSNLISSYPSMSVDPIQPHSVLGRDIIQFLLALSYQWRCRFGSLKSFQSHLAVRANTNIFLLPNVQLNFIVTCCSAIQWNET